MKTYDVIRDHGDFTVGDTREACPAEVAHLVGKCLVERKAEKPVKNKATKTLKNKAAD